MATSRPSPRRSPACARCSKAASRANSPGGSVFDGSQESGRVAALDLGETRTGLALSDPTRSLATPLEVIASEGLETRLRELVREEGVNEVVVGVPRTMSGETGFQAERALRELRRLREAFPQTSFVEWDERLTTRLAGSASGERGRGRSGRGTRKTRKSGGKERVDHLAAARILQEYLDRRE